MKTTDTLSDAIPVGGRKVGDYYVIAIRHELAESDVDDLKTIAHLHGFKSVRALLRQNGLHAFDMLASYRLTQRATRAFNPSL